MRILVVGAGATGGFVGGKLAEAGREVCFLLRERRAQQVREHGLTLVTPEGTSVVRPRVVTAGELRESREGFDVVVISTKAYQLQAAMDDAAPAVGAETMICRS